LRPQVGQPQQWQRHPLPELGHPLHLQQCSS
jgi:hypothetical protein